MRLLMTSRAKRLIRVKSSPAEVILTKNAGMSVALAFKTLGRAMSPRLDMDRSIFSLTSMKR